MDNCGDCKFRLFKYTILNKDSNLNGFEKVESFPFDDFVGNLVVKCKIGNTNKLLEWYEKYSLKNPESTKTYKCFEASPLRQIMDTSFQTSINKKIKK